MSCITAWICGLKIARICRVYTLAHEMGSERRYNAQMKSKTSPDSSSITDAQSWRAFGGFECTIMLCVSEPFSMRAAVAVAQHKETALFPQDGMQGSIQKDQERTILYRACSNNSHLHRFLHIVDSIAAVIKKSGQW